MPRRRLTLRRIDPWSVLRFGLVANACLLVIFLLGFGLLWLAIGQLGLIDQACQLATDVGFEQCGVNGPNLFRVLLLLGLLGVVVQTALFVFLAFLHNLIADLVGGIVVSVVEDAGAATMTSRVAPPARRLEPRPTPAAPAVERQLEPEPVPSVPRLGTQELTGSVTGTPGTWPWERPRPAEPAPSRPATAPAGDTPRNERRSEERLFGEGR